WSHLHTIKLDSIDTHEGHWMDFFERHASTIKNIRLATIRLLDGEWPDVLERMQQLLTLEEAEFDKDLSSVAPSQLWYLDAPSYTSRKDDSVQENRTRWALEKFMVHGGVCPLRDAEAHPQSRIVWPKDVIIPAETFTLKTSDIPKAADLKDGEVLFQSLYLSLDPAMRGWMNVQIGEAMRGACIGIIKASKSPSFPIGSYATGTVGWTEYAIVHSKALQKIEIPENGRLTDTLGVLGTTGLTAYFGILSVGQVKAGDFVVVSGAAGATGSVVGQIAKLKGARVLGIAGSEEKVRWLKDDLGFDDALNYNDADFGRKFKDATKDHIDLFFDNGNAIAIFNRPPAKVPQSAAKFSTSPSPEQKPMLAS
ncbi:MAG: hypothetical protein Q9204_007760, partial [Flavoplaca sp. TL-2023a]